MPQKLRVEYRTEDSFRREYAQNIANGGIFIPTHKPFEMREHIEIELVLAFRDQSVVLPGEVVHCIPAEMAETGASPGIAIQFLVDGEEVRSKLEAFAGPIAEVMSERAQGTGRREAPRRRARVTAHVEVKGKWTECHSRNVSASGMLIAFPEDPPPVGTKLKVRMDHPSRHEEKVEIAGVVARHVEASGEICLGVRFRVPEAQEQAVAEFIRQLRAVEHSRRLGGINGPIADLGIRSVLTMFGSSAPEGMLTLTRGSEEGYITIASGSLRAQVGGLCGREALDALMAWTSGSFEFEAQADESLVNGESIPVAEIAGEASAKVLPGPGTVEADAAEDAEEFELEEGIGEDQELELIDLDDVDSDSDSENDSPEEQEEGDDDDGFELDVDMIDFDDEDDDDDEEEEYEGDVAQASAGEAEEDEEGEEEEDDGGIGEFVLDDDDADDFDERARLDSVPISPDATLVLADDSDRSDFGKTEEALLDLAAVGLTVAKVVEIIPESEDEIYQALRNLIDEGLLALE